MIVLLHQLGDVARGAGRGNIRQRLRGLWVETHTRHVLREHRNERKPESLIKIRDELIARHLFELSVVAEALLERQMPVHIVGIPPGVLQTLPEETRLANAADFVPSRDDAFLAILAHKFAQRVHEFRFYIFEPLIVWAQVGRRSCSAALQGGTLSTFSRCRAEARRYARGTVAVRWNDRSWEAGPRFRCVVLVHSTSQGISRQSS